MVAINITFTYRFVQYIPHVLLSLIDMHRVKILTLHYRVIFNTMKNSPSWFWPKYLVTGIGYTNTQTQWPAIMFRWCCIGLNVLLLRSGDPGCGCGAAQKQRRLLRATVYRWMFQIHPASGSLLASKDLYIFINFYLSSSSHIVYFFFFCFFTFLFCFQIKHETRACIISFT